MKINLSKNEILILLNRAVIPGDAKLATREALKRLDKKLKATVKK